MNDDHAKLITGLVKWFDPAKGYGFILDSDGGADVLLHANVLRNFGRSSVADNARMVVRAHVTARGIQATEVVEIWAPEGDGTPPIADLGQDVIENLDQLPLHAARVKWFDKQKGFGFANVFGQSDDVFIHIEVLRQSGFSDLTIGEAVALRLFQGARGLIAAQVLAWDAAITGDAAAQDAGYCNGSDENAAL
ncbi:cold-shock protein [Paracoccus sp. (in: a-proteobacteria)]|uniref:cold-shock protein n=1 Tax=Paracoccus sp. TaxID=267 RepID=UPI0026DF210A|nr:cold shock domain-containing protein [Paracoccus sp. (in: a-proteobacteria)]MDO5646517.1 cold shock domain-containing protein [Paracoccus sp. (in: a-proteobacteria)]